MLKLKLAHHGGDGFRNAFPTPTPELDAEPEGDADLDETGSPVARAWGSVRPDGDFLRRNRQRPTLTWLGHSTFLLQLGGLNILTDPHLGERASALPYLGPKRMVPPALQVHQLPPIDIVVLSHDHHDHLDRRTVRRLIGQSGGPPRFYVPLGVKEQLGTEAYAFCTELDWWQWAQLQGVVMHCVPAHHDSGRLPWSQNQTLWCGWVIEHAGFRFYFAGDTGFSPVLYEIGRRFPRLELAALPIAGHASRWRQPGMHLSPAQAVRLFQEMGARHAVAMHWGTFAMDRQPLDLPARRLASAAAGNGLVPGAFFVMRTGETISLETFTGLERAAPASSRPPVLRESVPAGPWNLA